MATTVSYKSNTITTIDYGDSATLTTEGTWLEDDITISVDEMNLDSITITPSASSQYFNTARETTVVSFSNVSNTLNRYNWAFQISLAQTLETNQLYHIYLNVDIDNNNYVVNIDGFSGQKVFYDTSSNSGLTAIGIGTIALTLYCSTNIKHSYTVNSLIIKKQNDYIQQNFFTNGDVITIAYNGLLDNNGDTVSYDSQINSYYYMDTIIRNSDATQIINVNLTKPSNTIVGYLRITLTNNSINFYAYKMSGNNEVGLYSSLDSNEYDEFQNYTTLVSLPDGWDEITVNAIPSNYVIPTGTLQISGNGTYDVTSYASAEVNMASSINNQNKTVTPSESQQTISADSGYSGLGTVTVNAISSTYVGSGITRRSSSDLTASGATVTVPSGYYSSQATKSVSTTTHPNPTVSVNTSTGLITASHTQTAGYVSANTTTGTSQLSTQAAATITPTTSSQVAVAAGKYTLGAITVGAIPSNYVDSSSLKTYYTGSSAPSAATGNNGDLYFQTSGV